MSCDQDEKGNLVIGGVTIPLEKESSGEIGGKATLVGELDGNPLVETADGRQFVLMTQTTPGKTRLSVEKPIPKKSLHRTTQNYLAFGRGGLKKLIQHQQHASGLMKKPPSEAVLRKRASSKSAKPTQVMEAEKAAAPLNVSPKKRVKKGKRQHAKPQRSKKLDLRP